MTQHDDATEPERAERPGKRRKSDPSRTGARQPRRARGIVEPLRRDKLTGPLAAGPLAEDGGRR